jgi:hypothetical protein
MARKTQITTEDPFKVCSIRGPHRVMKVHVIDSQEPIVLSSRRLETRDQSKNQKKYSETFVIKKSSMCELL